MESSLSDGRIISGQLFTAFDEETKGTRVLADEGMAWFETARTYAQVTARSGTDLTDGMLEQGSQVSNIK